MYRQNAVLVELLEPVITALDYTFWGVEQSSDGRGVLIRIYIDNEAGISIEDCEQVSRQIVGVLDVEDPIQGAYNLEVSSPGLDRPLFTLEQFQQFAGEQVALRLRSKIAGRKKINGVIKAVEGNNAIIADGDESYRLDADEIEQAHILPQL